MLKKFRTAFSFYIKTTFYRPLFSGLTVVIYAISIGMICINCLVNEASNGRMTEFMFVAYSMLSYSTVFASASSISKFSMSSPCHETIVKRVLPVISIIKCLLITALIIILSNIGIANGNTTVQGFSDVLIVSAWSMFFILISAGVHPGIRCLVIMMTNIIPFLICSYFLLEENSSFRLSFGLPVSTSAVILAVTIATGSVLSFVFADTAYKNRKPVPHTAQPRL